MLKACVAKQKRYIDYLNKANKLSNKFYKDLKGVLNFLVEVDEKYVKSKKKVKHVEYLDDGGTSQNAEVRTKVLNDIYKDLGNSDAMKNFIINFNEAYDRVKGTNQKKEEFGKLFNLTLDVIKSQNPLAKKINPEVQKRIKYNYMFDAFIK